MEKQSRSLVCSLIIMGALCLVNAEFAVEANEDTIIAEDAEYDFPAEIAATKVRKTQRSIYTPRSPLRQVSQFYTL